MSKEPVIFKGSKDMLTVLLDEEKAFSEIIKNLENKLLKSKSFFSGSRINVCFNGRRLNEVERQSISNLFKEIAESDFVLSFELKEEKDNGNEDVFKGIDRGITVFKKGTVRSGQQILSEGNLVIIGDINPGAELIAAGNIVVMGSLRGIVHAGCDGNRDAIVSALYLQPTQLRIADIITRSPDGEAKITEPIPEIASIKDGRIYIEELRKNI